MSACEEISWGSICWDGEGWKKRHMAEISSMAIPFFLNLHARPAHSTSLLADSSLSGVKETTCTASWLEITSHTCAKQQITIIDLYFTTSQGKGNVCFSWIHSAFHWLKSTEVNTLNCVWLLFRDTEHENENSWGKEDIFWKERNSFYPRRILRLNMFLSSLCPSFRSWNIKWLGERVPLRKCIPRQSPRWRTDLCLICFFVSHPVPKRARNLLRSGLQRLLIMIVLESCRLASRPYKPLARHAGKTLGPSTVLFFQPPLQSASEMFKQQTITCICAYIYIYRTS